MAEPQVGIIMGSQSDWPTMKQAVDILDELGIAYETRIVSAHRTPDRLWDYGKTAVARGLQVIIAGAGGAAPVRMYAVTATTINPTPAKTVNQALRWAVCRSRRWARTAPCTGILVPLASTATRAASSELRSSS